MADSSKTAVGVGLGVAALGVLAAVFGAKKKSSLQGPPPPRKPCNCGR